MEKGCRLRVVGCRGCGFEGRVYFRASGFRASVSFQTCAVPASLMLSNPKP